MKKARSLRWRMFMVMAAIVLVQCVVLILSVFMSGVFTQLDAEAYRFFSNDAAERTLSFDGKVGTLIHNLFSKATDFNDDAQKASAVLGIPLTDSYSNDELYARLTQAAAVNLVDFLRNNNVTGAFILLNGSNAQKDDKNAHSGIYIRDNAPGMEEQNNSNLQYEIGPIAAARDNHIPTSVRWSLDINFSEENNTKYLFYENPIRAVKEHPRSELLRYGYWSIPIKILNDNQEAVTYTLPVLDSKGVPFGVIGFEISLTYLTQEYLSNTNLPYASSFFAITSLENNTIDADWVIPGSPTARAYLQPGNALKLAPVKNTGLYSTVITGRGDASSMYCVIDTLTMYSKNSPFIGENWSLVGFVPKGVLDETSSGIRNILLMSMLATTGIAFLAIFLIAYLSTRKVRDLSKFAEHLTPGGPMEFPPTGLQEIDELTDAVEQLNHRIADASKIRSQMLELTQLPLGGFEVSSDLEYVVLTEYIYHLLGLKSGSTVTQEHWDILFNKLKETPADGYDDTYRFKLEGQDKQKWLRIVETPTETGAVGMILDVTKDIEEHRRLAHELDSDALTHLYNRMAFKRETYKAVDKNPNKIGAMIFSDLDNLKYINDTFGHEMGDKLITTAAEMFRKFEDYGGLAARISGDEFAVFLYGYNTKEEVKNIVNKIFADRDHYSFVTPDGITQRLRFSSGIAWYPQDSDDLTDLLKLSDYAMYEAKHTNKGTLSEFSRESYKKNSTVLQNREAISKLLDEEQVTFALQPIVNMQTGKVYGYEALMRSLMKEFNTPAEIFSVAKAQSKLGYLERLLIFKTFEMVAENLNLLGDRLVFVNSIPGQRLSDEDFTYLRDFFSYILDHVVIEITEAEYRNPKNMHEKITEVREANIPLAVDNFGSGNANEIRVLGMNPDIVKIGMNLIQGLHKDAYKQNLVRNLVIFCHNKGILTVAEGVEDIEDLKVISRMHIDFAQGYLLGKPEFEFAKTPPDIKQLIIDLYEENNEN